MGIHVALNSTVFLGYFGFCYDCTQGFDLAQNGKGDLVLNYLTL